jgi:hypothetical protein
VLKENVINKWMTFKRKLMRKIYGPTTTDDGYCRIETNQEINDIQKGQNIIGFIKKQTLNILSSTTQTADWTKMYKLMVHMLVRC